jgi:hypothetical protein
LAYQAIISRYNYGGKNRIIGSGKEFAKYGKKESGVEGVDRSFWVGDDLGLFLAEMMPCIIFYCSLFFG